MTIDGDRTFTYGYDVDGRVVGVTDFAARDIAFTYDAAGRLATIVRPAGVSTSYTYDDAGGVVSIVHANDSGVVASYGYTRDADGQRHVGDRAGRDLGLHVR